MWNAATANCSQKISAIILCQSKLLTKIVEKASKSFQFCNCNVNHSISNPNMSCECVAIVTTFWCFIPVCSTLLNALVYKPDSLLIPIPCATLPRVQKKIINKQKNIDRAVQTLNKNWISKHNKLYIRHT